MGLELVRKAQALKYQGGNTPSTLVPGFVPTCYEVFSNNTLLIIDFLCQKDVLLETYNLEFVFLYYPFSNDSAALLSSYLCQWSLYGYRSLNRYKTHLRQAVCSHKVAFLASFCKFTEASLLVHCLLIAPSSHLNIHVRIFWSTPRRIIFILLAVDITGIAAQIAFDKAHPLDVNRAGTQHGDSRSAMDYSD